jgi:hypothetical protein
VIAVSIKTVKIGPNENRVLNENVYVTESVGKALDQHAPNPRRGAEFIITIVATDVATVF